MNKRKYYYLSNSPEPKIIGVRNGLYQSDINWKMFEVSNKKIIEDYFSLDKYISNIAKIETTSISLERVEAQKSAKITDLFTFSPTLWGMGFLFSEKAKTILSEFTLPMHKWIDASVFHKEIKYKYWGLYIPVSYREDSLDLSKCIFKEHISFRNYKHVTFNTLEELINARYFPASTLGFLKEKFDESLDLFSVSYGGRGYFISEKLKTKIENFDLTGFDIRITHEPQLVIS